MSKYFDYKAYYKQPAEEVKLYNAWKNETDERRKEELYKKLLDYRGISFSTEENNGKEVTEYFLSDIKFIKYILTCFKTVYFCASVMFYNWFSHMYEIVEEAYYLAMFKHLIDKRVKTLWNSKLEGKYKKRFIREIPKKITEWQMPEGVHVFDNGYFNVNTGVFSYGDHPDEIINRCATGYAYDKEAKCEHFKAFLKDVFNNDDQLIAVAQEMAGYCLQVGSSPLAVITILLAQGRNGKTVFCNTIQKMLGSSNVAGVPVQKLSGQFSLGDMSTKVLNICSENDEACSVSTAILKSISGGDLVRTEMKYKDALSERLFVKIWINTNDIIFSDSSKGFEERIVPLIFKNVYVSDPVPGTNQRLRNNNIEMELSKELPGIFNFCYEGLVRLRNNGWTISDSDEVKKQRQLLVEASNPVQLFFRTMIIPHKGQTVRKSQVYKKFMEWSSVNKINVGSIVSSQKFYPKFESILNGKGMVSSTKRIHGYDYFSNFELSSNLKVF